MQCIYNTIHSTLLYVIEIFNSNIKRKYKRLIYHNRDKGVAHKNLVFSVRCGVSTALSRDLGSMCAFVVSLKSNKPDNQLNAMAWHLGLNELCTWSHVFRLLADKLVVCIGAWSHHGKPAWNRHYAHFVTQVCSRLD